MSTGVRRRVEPRGQDASIRFRRRAGSRGEDARSMVSCKCCVLNLLLFLVCGAFGVFLAYSSAPRYQPQTVGDVVFSFFIVGVPYFMMLRLVIWACINISRACRSDFAALRHARLRERFPAGGKWPDRGWLVMLRARDRRALAKPKRRLTPFWWCCRYRRAELTLRNTVVFDTSVSGDGGADEVILLDVDIEQCEGGRSSWELTRTVAAVVEMEEEGLFRNIVTYL